MIGIDKLNDRDYELFNKLEFKESIQNKLSNKTLLLSELPQPHEEIAILFNIDQAKIEKYCHKKGFHCYRYSSSITLIKRQDFKQYELGGYLFSGYMFYNNKFIFGNSDFENNAEKYLHNNISNEYGEYALFKVEENKIVLDSDYYGMVSIFYYHNAQKFASSNSYHFLLEILTYCEEKLQINLNQSLVNLMSIGFELGGAFSRDMDVNNIKISYPYETIVFDCTSNTVKIEKSDLFEILSSNESYDENLYEQLLIKGKNEILNNVESILANDKFKRVVIDLSGGFDSRVVFGCADQQKASYRNKICIYSRPSHNSDDYDIASYIRSIFGYERYSYVDVDCSEVVQEQGFNLAQISRNLGSFGCHTEFKLSNIYNDSTIELMGGIGDATMAYKFVVMPSIDNNLTEDTFLDRLGRPLYWRNVHQLQSIFDKKLEIVKSTLNEYNCSSLFQKLHTLYVISRNRFHFGSSRNIFHDNPYANPIQSKNILRAKWLYLSKFSNNEKPHEKIAMDLLFKINPLLTLLPFASENNNVLPTNDEVLHPLFVEKLSLCKENISNTPPIVSSGVVGDKKYTTHVKEWLQNIEISEYMLKKINEYSKEYTDLCTALYKLLQQFKQHNNDTNTFYNVVRKINDLYFQIICISHSDK